MDSRLLIVDFDTPSPFSECRVGRVRMLQREDYMAVFLDHRVYTYTDDMIYAERGDILLFSRWPMVYEALIILRVDMILDDLSLA